jgi:hypothetical protein
MAEKGGFEPPRPLFGSAPLAGVCIRPLCHFSAQPYFAPTARPSALQGLEEYHAPREKAKRGNAFSGKSKTADALGISGFQWGGAVGRIRTRDPLVRSQVLYPTELLPHAGHGYYTLWGAVASLKKKNTKNKVCRPGTPQARERPRGAPSAFDRLRGEPLK